MAADRTWPTLKETDELHSSDPGLYQDHGGPIPKRHARVTVKYNRKELQRRLDLEKWIDESLVRLYSGQEGDMPDEVNIDDLIDLPNDEERVKRLQELLRRCSSNTEVRFLDLHQRAGGEAGGSSQAGRAAERGHRASGHLPQPLPPRALPL
ncbi:protein phosphatase 1, regulatory (inhibitor) subunit 14Aa isoform X2 [Anarrhichthys ocellatus]|uniref:protein phosphatase 1, regulatory (inhibitor) subunit 14Aa isoform X2 n=1 Tax=Anarrhichthys ocellatus TaxID=433405 RepID=UPI0012EDB509|nr:protein phosphatase 1 regulatory subunit 14A-like isoform X2 [Anarrhichthys ocellatus]